MARPDRRRLPFRVARIKKHGPREPAPTKTYISLWRGAKTRNAVAPKVPPTLRPALGARASQTIASCGPAYVRGARNRVDTCPAHDGWQSLHERVAATCRYFQSLPRRGLCSRTFRPTPVPPGNAPPPLTPVLPARQQIELRAPWLRPPPHPQPRSAPRLRPHNLPKCSAPRSAPPLPSGGGCVRGSLRVGVGGAAYPEPPPRPTRPASPPRHSPPPQIAASYCGHRPTPARRPLASVMPRRTQPPNDSEAPRRMAPPTSAPPPRPHSLPTDPEERPRRPMERAGGRGVLLHGPQTPPPPRIAPQAQSS